MFLRNPRFGNTFTLDNRLQVHKAGGTHSLIFRPDSQPNVHKFEVSFEALTALERDRLFVFFEQSAGQIIQLEDHEGTLWSGVITNDDIVFTEGRGCKWSTGFSFQSEV